jgi:hypothetical protein
MLEKNRTLRVVGLTESADTSAIEAFRETAGAAYPMLHGLSAATKEAYGVTGYPSLRVVDRQGRRAGDGLEALERALAP